MRFEYDKVVIGGCLRSLLYAFNNRYPIFFTTPRKPFRFDYMEDIVGSPLLGLQATSRKLSTPHGDMHVGISMELLWERLFFLLSMEGLAPLTNLCTQMRYTTEGITCANEYSKIYEFSFNTCYYFGDSHTSSLVTEYPIDEDIYICYDYIAFHKGGKHEIDYIHTTDDFVSEIWFYSSDRIDGNTGVKDACIVSRLKKEQLLDPEYSETMARFKMEKVLRDNGMRGPLNGYDSKGRPKHYRFKTSHITRTKERLTAPLWDSTALVQSVATTQGELITALHKNEAPLPLILRCDYTLPA